MRRKVNKIALLSTFTMGLLTGLAMQSQAIPEYAKKENKDCGYCHLRPNGGGPRNPRGRYYATHNHTFEGYNEEAVMGAAKAAMPGAGRPNPLLGASAPPAFTWAWKAALPAGISRIALADLADDGRPRLLALEPGNLLTLCTVSTPPGETTVVIESSINIGANGAKFAAGRFTTDKSPVILVPGAAYTLNGGKYERKLLPALRDLNTRVRFVDGNEQFVSLSSNGALESQQVNLTGGAVVPGGKLPANFAQAGGVLREMTIHESPDKLSAFGVPSGFEKAGVVAGFDPRGDGRFYLCAPYQGTEGNYLAVFDTARNGQFYQLWRSAKLNGKILDIAVGADPKGSKKNGILVLLATGAEGKDRRIEFHALN